MKQADEVGNEVGDPLAPWTLEDSGFAAIDTLFRSPAFAPHTGTTCQAEDQAEREQLFIAAMAESYAYHQANSLEYRGHVALDTNAPQQLASMADVEQIPWMFVQNFKEAELTSVPADEVEIVLTSSGTSGSQTKTFLDHTSLNRLQVAGYEVYKGLDIVKNAASACNYLMFTYDIAEMPNLGTAWTDVYIAQMVKANEMVFLIRKKTPDAPMEFDLELAIETYQRFAASGLPLRILGFPAFMYHTFMAAQQRGIASLSPEAARDSWVLTGGGWKNHKGEVIGKRDFAQFIQTSTGVPVSQVRDLFGMAEHGIGYVDCEHGRLHVPLYAHAVTRDPMTLKIQPPGTCGILQLFTPLLKSSPALSLLTTDEVILHAEPCACGRSGMGLEYVGRLGLTQYEGCAIRALEYLKT